MIGYIYCTVTTDSCYYIGQHKRSTFNDNYYGSGRMLKGKKVDRCYMIDSADTLEELNSKEIYWIHKCVEKHGAKCINLCARASNGNQKFIVNRHDHSIVYSDLELFAKKIGVSVASVQKWIYRFNYGSKGLMKYKHRKLKKYHKELIEDWIYMPVSIYMKHFAV